MLPDRCEVLVVALGEVCHHVLGALGQLAHHAPGRPGDPNTRHHYSLLCDTSIAGLYDILPAEGWDNGFWRKDCAILDVAAVPDGAPSPDHTVLADVDVGVDHGGVDDAPLADVDVVADLQREESHALAELLEGRPDDGLAGDDAVPPHPHVGEVAADDGLGLDNVFTIEDDVLGTAKNTLTTDSIATSCLYVFSLIERDVWKLHISEMCNSMYRIVLLQVYKSQ